MEKLFEKSPDIKDLFPVREDTNGDLVYDNHTLVCKEDGYYASTENDKEYWIGLALTAAKALPGLIKQGKKLLKGGKKVSKKGGKLMEVAAPILKTLLEKQEKQAPVTKEEEPETEEVESVGEEETEEEYQDAINSRKELEESLSPALIAKIIQRVKETLTQKDYDKLSEAFVKGFEEGLKNGRSKVQSNNNTN